MEIMNEDCVATKKDCEREADTRSVISSAMTRLVEELLVELLNTMQWEQN